MIRNNKDREIIHKLAEDINRKDKEDMNYINVILETIYELGIKEGKSLVIKNSIEFVTKG